MSKPQISSAALRDFREIIEYIERDRPAVAAQIGDEILAACDTLANNPMMGTARSELRDGLRSFTVKGYVIYFNCVQDSILVRRIVHGARRMQFLF